MRITAWKGLALTAYIAALGCSDSRLVQPSTELSATLQRGLGATGEVNPGEELLYEFARKEPSFAGFFQQSDGTFVVLTTSDESASRTRSLVREAIAKNRVYRNNAESPRIESRLASYSFAEMASWRDEIRSHAGSLGLLMLDLNEAKNVISVGIDGSKTSIELVRGGLVARGVPEQALEVLAEGATKDVSVPTASARSSMVTSLHDFADSLVGGMRWTWWQTGGQPELCTVGYAASGGGGELGFLTAGHCSPNKWVTDGTTGRAGQPSTYFEIGYELYDPTGGTCPALWFCSEYRFADASFVLSTSRPVKVGYLAAPPFVTAVELTS